MSEEQFDELKRAHRALWQAGEYARIADGFIRSLGVEAVERAGVSAGQRVLDVAAGTGNAAIPAAERGGEVTAIDLAPELLAVGAKEAERAGLRIEWIAGDAEALPFEDAAFDRVVSVVGTQFVPHHAQCAAEVARVCRPGGRIVLINWTPESFPGRMLKIVGSHMPPPPDGVSPPPLWGTEEHVREQLGGHGLELSFDRGVVIFEAGSARELVDVFAESYGPLVKARERVGDEWPTVEAELVEMVEEIDGEGPGLSAPGPYLVVTAER